MSAQCRPGPSDDQIQEIAARLLKNFGRVLGSELADAVAAHYPMDDETYWAIRPAVFAFAKATESTS